MRLPVTLGELLARGVPGRHGGAGADCERIQFPGIAREMAKNGREKVRRAMKEGFGECLRPFAEAGLSQYLVELCERPDVRFTRPALSEGGQRAPWYFPRVADAILRFIDRRKLEATSTIAETAVSREIFKWLGKPSRDPATRD
jgi:hypothetical protein